MTVQELIAELQQLPATSLVILQKDAEGNGYSPCSGTDVAVYMAESTWSGDSYRLDDPDRPVGAVPCVVLYPIN